MFKIICTLIQRKNVYNILALSIESLKQQILYIICSAWIEKKLEDEYKRIKQKWVPEELNVLLSCEMLRCSRYPIKKN